MKTHPIALASGVLLAMCALVGAAELSVGPGKTFASITDALAKAQAGDTILVHAQEGNKAYEKVAVMVRKERLTFKAVPAKPGQRVPLSGAGFNYTGAGSTPRAIFQFDPAANGCVLEGFELRSAHNDSFNGAGVRINQANDVTVRDCEIHDCDMGIMSNGNGTPKTAVNQRIESCLIHSNGNQKQPGQNHNLYLGGTSVTLSACEVHSSITGHNVKSRAHFTRVEYCYIHDSANREFDLVDAKGDTTVPGSDAVLVGNIIVKDPKCSGNRSTIHFGQDGGNEHEGTLWLVHNTIVSPFVSPVVDLSAGKAGVKFLNNIVWDGGSGQKNQTLVKLAKGGGPGSVSVPVNWLSGEFKAPQGVVMDGNVIARAGQSPAFVDAAARDFHLKSADATIVGKALSWDEIKLPVVPGAAEPKSQPALQEYKAPLSVEDRPGFKPDKAGDLGAFGFDPQVAPK
jgi:hypothetical protein